MYNKFHIVMQLPITMCYGLPIQPSIVIINESRCWGLESYSTLKIHEMMFGICGVLFCVLDHENCDLCILRLLIGRKKKPWLFGFTEHQKVVKV